MSGGCETGTAGVGSISALRPSRSHHVRTPAGDFNISLDAVSQSGLFVHSRRAFEYIRREVPQISGFVFFFIFGHYPREVVSLRTRNATSFGAQRGAGDKPLPFSFYRGFYASLKCLFKVVRDIIILLTVSKDRNYKLRSALLKVLREL